MSQTADPDMTWRAPAPAAVDRSSDDGLLSSCGVVYFKRDARDKLCAEISQTLGRYSDSGTGTVAIPIKDLLELIAAYAVSPVQYVTTVCQSNPKSHLHGIGRIGTTNTGTGSDDSGTGTTLVLTSPNQSAVELLRISRAGAMMSVVTAVCSRDFPFFWRPRGLALDPRTNDGSFFVGDVNRVCRVSGSDGAVHVFAGQNDEGRRDGTCQEARFCECSGLASTIDPILGPVVYVCDFGNYLLRRIEIKNDRVSTLAGGAESGCVDGALGTSRLSGVEFCCWDRGPHLARTGTDSDQLHQHHHQQQRLYLVSHGIFRRYDCDTGLLHTVPLPPSTDRNHFAGPKCLPSGKLIVPCVLTKIIYVIDPSTGQIQGISKSVADGPFVVSGRLETFQFGLCMDLEVVDDECAIYVAEYSTGAVRRVQLSDTYF